MSAPTPPRPSSAPPQAPARPSETLPPRSETVNAWLFADEFDPIQPPDPAVAKANRLDCNSKNMNYIPSNLATLPFQFDSFFQKMTKHQWKEPFVKRDAVPTHVSRGILPIGARRDLGDKPMTQDRSKPIYGKHAKDWDLIPSLQRVNAYSFRGDKRPPREIKAAGGFHPPSTRTDATYVTEIARKFVIYMKERFGKVVKEDDVVNYINGQGKAGFAFVEYEIWRSILKGEELHVGKMVADEFLKGYISTSRDVDHAYTFLTAATGAVFSATEPALYAVHTEGGFLLPPQSAHVHGTTGEAEIAHPGSLPWINVMAFRCYIKADMNDPRTFSKKSEVLFVRKGFLAKDPVGAQRVIWALASLSNV